MLRVLSRTCLSVGSKTGIRTSIRPVATSSKKWSDEKRDVTSAKFLEGFAKVAPITMDPPTFPQDYMKEDLVDQTEGEDDTKLSLNFFLPSKTIHSNEKVDLVLVPSQSGDFGIMSKHVPTVAQLRPGVITIHKEQDKDVSKYFVSSGFAFVHENSVADICAVEAVPLEDIDANQVKSSLAEAQGKLSASADEVSKAEAQIAVDVLTAMEAAVVA